MWSRWIITCLSSIGVDICVIRLYNVWHMKWLSPIDSTIKLVCNLVLVLVGDSVLSAIIWWVAGIMERDMSQYPEQHGESIVKLVLVLIVNLLVIWLIVKDISEYKKLTKR